ncbi:MAG: four helix bundle protein [Gemmatimonadales bacterium]
MRRFEDLRVWQEARLLCAAVDAACETLLQRRNYGLADQMRRAAISIASNIAEGFERHSPRSFRYFLLIAKGSSAELKCQIYLCVDRGYLNPSAASDIQQRATAVSQMLWGLITYLDRRKTRIFESSSRGTRNEERGTDSS